MTDRAMSEALRLAEFCEGNVINNPVAAELRRLHAENEALRAEVERIANNRDMWRQQCFNQAAALERVAARKEST